MLGIRIRARQMVAMIVLGCAGAMAARGAEPQAAPVRADAAVKPDAVHGLRVAFYDFYPKDANGIDTLAIAKNWIAGHDAILTYDLNLATIDSPRGGEMSIDSRKIELGRFLLGDKEYDRR